MQKEIFWFKIDTIPLIFLPFYFSPLSFAPPAPNFFLRWALTRGAYHLHEPPACKTCA